MPGVNATTAFGTLANVQINFSEPVQNPVPLIRMCVNPCGLPIAAAVTYGEVTGPIAHPRPDRRPSPSARRTRSSSRRFVTGPATC